MCGAIHIVLSPLLPVRICDGDDDDDDANNDDDGDSDGIADAAPAAGLLLVERGIFIKYMRLHVCACSQNNSCTYLDIYAHTSTHLYI